MNWGGVFISLPDACSLFCRTSSRTIGYSVVLSVLCLAGCVQDTPPSSKEHTVSLLLELLRDKVPEMRQMAAESLGKIGDPRVADSILPLIHDRAAIVRAASLLAMGRMKPTPTDGVVALLARALEDSDESVRQAAVVAIGEIEPDSRLLKPVVGLLRSSDATIRRGAVRALLQVDSSQWVPALVGAGRDSDAEVRQGIVAVVGEWGGSAVSPWLRERLVEDPSPGVRAEAAYRLGMLIDPEARAALSATIAKDPDRGVRRWAKRGT
ncbi:MAG TPA: HEAT repeat domain-containing protein [Nitrospiraceae bacterium]|nr:HEAT repeat domain-containing protein [Nitrospiraceae bacterium]